MNVTKRDKTTEAWNFRKVVSKIEICCKDLEVDNKELIERFDQFLFDGISTEAIHANVTEHARRLASGTNPDWVKVAGRNLTIDRWAKTGAYKKPFVAYVRDQISAGVYKHPGIEGWSDAEIQELGESIVQYRDMDHSYASVRTAEDKYLLPGECIQQMFMVNAMIIAHKDPDRMNFAKQVYYYTSVRKISMASPWLMYLRSGKNISSCFVFAPDDNLESQTAAWATFATISKFGGGAGCYLGRIRAAGSYLMGILDKAKGTVPFAKIMNDIALYINQGGKRAGAITVALPLWHADIMAFLDMQTELGDQRTKAYDVKPQICVNDLFMRIKGQKGDGNTNDWYTFCPHEVQMVLGIELWDCYGQAFDDAYHACVKAYEEGRLKVVRIYRAKELWKQVMRNQFETGMPYVFYSDTANRLNPNPHVGKIYCANLCTESFSSFTIDGLIHACNLLSVVAGRVEPEEMEEVCAISSKILDNGLDITNIPVPGANEHNNLIRTIGIGIQGLHDVLAKNNKSYESHEWISDYMENFLMCCIKGSVKLARERGAYPAFEGSDWQNGTMFKHYASLSKNPEKWMALYENEVSVWGMRNGDLVSPAPNTTTSIFMDAAAGWAPVYNAFFYEDNSMGPMPVAAMYLKEKPLNYARDITRYKPAVLAQSLSFASRWVDAGLSAEFLMDKNDDALDASYLWDVHENVHVSVDGLKVCKASYYIRTLKRGEKLVKTDSDCVGCAN